MVEWEINDIALRLFWFEEEDGNLNNYERKVIWELSGLENRKMLLIETKGDHLDIDESEVKAKCERFIGKSNDD